MEAQAAAQKLAAAQHMAQAAVIRGQVSQPQENMESEEHDEPTDLTMDSEAKLRMRRERFEREVTSRHQEQERDRDPLEPRHHQFDFRHLIPQVSIKE